MRWKGIDNHCESVRGLPGGPKRPVLRLESIISGALCRLEGPESLLLNGLKAEELALQGSPCGVWWILSPMKGMH